MKVIYPGTFDPPTFGHLDIIKRLSQMFDEVVVALLINGNKNPIFTLDERIEMIKSEVDDHNLKNVSIKTFDGLMVNFAKEEDAHIIARGLRGMADYEYEKNLARVNEALYKGLETVYLLSNPDYSHISSSMVKEVASFEGDISSFVSKDVECKMKEKYNY